jgi:hypothetical protein
MRSKGDEGMRSKEEQGGGEGGGRSRGRRDAEAGDVRGTREGEL